MTVDAAWPLLQAVYARLTAELAGDAPGGGDVPVFSYLPSDEDLDGSRVHARIDGLNITQREIKNCNSTRIFFFVHWFDRPTTHSSAARGQKTVLELAAKGVAALHGWTPAVTGAGPVRHQFTGPADDEDGLAAHAVSRFSIYVGG